MDVSFPDFVQRNDFILVINLRNISVELKSYRTQNETKRYRMGVLKYIQYVIEFIYTHNSYACQDDMCSVVKLPKVHVLIKLYHFKNFN